MRTITLLVLHCSATRVGQPCTVADIDRWHRARGFRCIGYHWVVDLEGRLHAGRPEHQIGAHVKNHNLHSIGVCYIGGLDKDGHPADTRTPAQKETLSKLFAELHRRYPRAQVVGHRDLSPDRNHDGRITPNEFVKACPCLDAVKEYGSLFTNDE